MGHIANFPKIDTSTDLGNGKTRTTFRFTSDYLSGTSLSINGLLF
jgi:hypothetical protein